MMPIARASKIWICHEGFTFVICQETQHHKLEGFFCSQELLPKARPFFCVPSGSFLPRIIRCVLQRWEPSREADVCPKVCICNSLKYTSWELIMMKPQKCRFGRWFFLFKLGDFFFWFRFHFYFFQGLCNRLDSITIWIVPALQPAWMAWKETMLWFGTHPAPKVLHAMKVCIYHTLANQWRSWCLLFWDDFFLEKHDKHCCLLRYIPSPHFEVKTIGAVYTVLRRS